MTDISPLESGQPVIVDNVLYHANSIVATWMHDKMGETQLVETGFRAFGIIDPASKSERISERIIAGAYFHSHKDINGWRDITVAVAMQPEAMIHPKSIKRILEYPFTQLGLPGISAEIDIGNLNAVKGAGDLGFELIGTKRLAGANGGDVGVFRLYPDKCPFWKD